MSRTIAAPQIDLLQGAHRAHHQRVWIADALGSLVDFSDYLLPGTVHEQGINEQVDALTLHFDRSIGASSLSPLMTAEKPIDLGRAVVWEEAVTSLTANPVEDDWLELFRGTVRMVDPTTNDMVVLCQDLAGTLRELYTLPGSTYATGMELETAVQAALSAAPGAPAITLEVPVSPDASLTEAMAQPHELLLQAAQTLADSIGWSTRYWWHEVGEEFRFSLLGPPRDKVDPDWITGPNRYLAVRELKLDKTDIRNHVTVYFGLQNADGEQTSVVVEDAASIAKYGLLPMILREGTGSPIQTAGQAYAFGAAAVADLSEPDATHAVEDFDLPHIQIWDLIEFAANNVHYNTVQRLAVQTIRREFSAPGVAHITLGCRGKPSAGVGAWKRRERAGRFGATPTVDESIYALNNFTRRYTASAMESTWEPGSLVAEIWIADVLYAVEAMPLDPYPSADDLSDYQVLSVGTDPMEYSAVIPPFGFVRCLQFEARTASLGFGPGQGTIIRFEVQPNQVGTEGIEDDAVTTPKIPDRAVVAIKIGLEAVEAANIKLRAVGTTQLALAGVERDNVANAAINAAKMSISQISDIATNIGAMVAGRLDNLPASAFINLNATGASAVIGHPKFALYANGDATFAGSLVAVTGTFAGSLSAATGTFAGTVTASAVLAQGIVLTSLVDNELTQAQMTRLVVNGGIVASKLSVSELSELANDMGIVIHGELRNAAGSRYIDLDASGASPFIKHDKFEIRANGDAIFTGQLIAATGTFTGSLTSVGGTFTGALVAATGSFAGSLSAASGSFTGSLTGATGTFAGSLSAATGTFSGSLTVGRKLGDLTTDAGIIRAGYITNHIGANGTAGISLAAGPSPDWTRYLDLSGAGAFYLFSADVKIDHSGNATFAGDLVAAGGTFNGTLTVDTAGLGNSLDFEHSGATVGAMTTNPSGIEFQAGASALQLDDNAALVSSGDVTLGSTAGGDFILLNIPTSSPGGTGKVWNNSGVLTIT